MHEITTTNLANYFLIIFILSVIDKSKSIEIMNIDIKMTNSSSLASAAAGHCYQCNSRNPLCELYVNATLKIDGTPCNGQCYIRLNRDDEYTIYRGCSWEHGFINPQERNILVLEGNSVWAFCDTP